MIRTLMMLCLAGATTACATRGPDQVAAEDPIIQTERYAVKVQLGTDGVMLAPHRDGLSRRQTQALANMVDRWRDAGGGEITVLRAPGDDETLDRAAQAVAARLAALGVEPDEIRIARYAAGEAPGNAMMVSFGRDVAIGPKCGLTWQSLTSSATNQSNSNFGCAMTANLAAMIDNPDDILGLRPSDSVDAQQRNNILSKYRTGDMTASVKDPQANGSVSSTGGQ